MYRFAALLWDIDDKESATQANRISASLRRPKNSEWQPVLCVPGILVLDTGNSASTARAHILANDEGVVLGHLFRRTGGTDSSRTQLDEKATAAIANSGGRSLTSEYWGAYVAILRTSANESLVVRDCSGALPCFRTRTGRIDIVFSDMRDAAELGALQLTVDWKYVAAFLYFDDLHVRACGLKEVVEVLPGDGVKFRDGSAEHFVAWNPAAISETNVLDDSNEAAANIRHVAQGCVDVWARHCRGILLQLSGGFDSAVVLGLLTSAADHPAVTCLNRYTLEVDEDERQFARLAAKQAGVPLTEQDWNLNGSLIDEALFEGPLIAKPTLDVFGRSDALFRARLAAEVGATAMWTGQGGDHIFMQRGTTLLAADYFLRHGRLSTDFFRALRDAAKVTEASYWTVLRHTATAVYPRRGTDQSPRFVTPPDFVQRDALPADMETYSIHPWCRLADSTEPGKRVQIQDLADLVSQQSPYWRTNAISEMHPLISQPLIEAFLSVPTYALLRGGMSRSLAKTAFREMVPAEILRRDDKGSTKTYTMRAIRRSMPFIRELLLDGELRRARLLNTEATESVLCGNRPLGATQLFPLMACVATEVWIRQWTCPVPVSRNARSDLSNFATSA